MRKAIIIPGGILLIISVFAKQLGIDNDEGWGTGRVIILLVGVAVSLTGILAIYHPYEFSKFVDFVSSTKHVLAAVMTVTVMYVWLAQLNLKYTRKDYNYYGELASSFKRGHLYLAEEPSHALLSLKNPYDYNLRLAAKVEDFPWDVSLYDQKFYLYWGPSPSLILSALRNDLIPYIGDRHLVAVFAWGLFIYATLIVVMFYERSLPNAPSWLTGLSILTLGLAAPATIMLQESRVYQAAVFGCQFFFIGGCYWIYSAIGNDKLSGGKLVIAGLHWALALGTRITIAPVILWSAGVTLIYVFLTNKVAARELFFSAAAIGIPLLAALAGLGWYNWARFDSVFETGLKYQLTGTNYLTFKDLFSGRYIGMNFYNYFIHPLLIRPRFPYLFRIEYPFTSERLGGLIFITPYILLAFLPILSRVRYFRSHGDEFNISKIRSNPEYWLLTTFAGSAIIGLVTVVAFWWTEMRYLEDFMPSLLLFTIVGIGMEYRSLQNNFKGQKLLAFLIVPFSIITIIASILVALKSDSMFFWVNLADTILKILKFK